MYVCVYVDMPTDWHGAKCQRHHHTHDLDWRHQVIQHKILPKFSNISFVCVCVCVLQDLICWDTRSWPAVSRASNEDRRRDWSPEDVRKEYVVIHTYQLCNPHILIYSTPMKSVYIILPTQTHRPSVSVITKLFSSTRFFVWICFPEEHLML